MLSHLKSSDLHWRSFSLLFLAWENSRHFLTPPMVSLWNDVWGVTIDFGSASDLFDTNLKVQPIRSTTQIWGVTCQQYGISLAVPQMWFCRESSIAIVKWRLFSQGTPCLVNCAFDMGILCLPHTWQLTTQLVVYLFMPEPYTRQIFWFGWKGPNIKYIILLNEPTF